MSKQLVIKHDLSKLSPDELAEYLGDVSEFIGLPADLNALDTIWMQNENGPGQSLVVYARRGTAEILRNKLGIEVISLTQTITPQGSIVFTATGKANGTLGSQGGRQEIAIGSKYIVGLQGKALDDAIMTASTRALRRLTMQFTSLGILDESEVGAIKGSNENPAAAATLAGSAAVMPPPPSVPANNGPGKDITPASPAYGDLQGCDTAPRLVTVSRALSAPYAAPPVDQKTNLAEVYRDGADALEAIQAAREADKKADILTTNTVVTPVAAPVTGMNMTDTPAAKPKRARKKANTVSMDGPEAEVVSSPAPAPPLPPAPAPAPPQTPAALPYDPQAVPPAAASAPPLASPPASAPALSNVFEGKPTDAQMADYRKRVGVYTAELPSSENMGSVQKMRAFITRNSGTAPQFMTTDQWEEILAWFESFVAKNAVKGLVKYINDSLGVK